MVAVAVKGDADETEDYVKGAVMVYLEHFAYAIVGERAAESVGAVRTGEVVVKAGG